MCHSAEKIPAKTGDACPEYLWSAPNGRAAVLNFDESTFYEFLVLLEFGF